MGNVGRHYMEWRYPDGIVEPPAVVPTPPATGGDGPASDLFAMHVGNTWTYEDHDSGDVYQVEVTGRSTGFIRWRVAAGTA